MASACRAAPPCHKQSNRRGRTQTFFHAENGLNVLPRLRNSNVRARKGGGEAGNLCTTARKEDKESKIYVCFEGSTKSTLLTLTLALALEFAQNKTKGEGAFLSTVEFGGRRWTNDEMSPS